MANQQLVDYIKSQLAVGVTKEDLRKAIAAAGWTAADAQAAFDVVEGKAPAAPPPTAQPPAQPQLKPQPVAPLQSAQPLPQMRPPLESAKPQPFKPIPMRRRTSPWVWWVAGLVVVLALLAALIYFVPTLRTIAAWYLAGMPASNTLAPVQEMPPPIAATSTQETATSTVTTTAASSASGTSTSAKVISDLDAERVVLQSKNPTSIRALYNTVAPGFGDSLTDSQLLQSAASFSSSLPSDAQFAASTTVWQQISTSSLSAKISGSSTTYVFTNTKGTWYLGLAAQATR